MKIDNRNFRSAIWISYKKDQLNMKKQKLAKKQKLIRTDKRIATATGRRIRNPIGICFFVSLWISYWFWRTENVRGFSLFLCGCGNWNDIEHIWQIFHIPHAWSFGSRHDFNRLLAPIEYETYKQTNETNSTITKMNIHNSIQ